MSNDFTELDRFLHEATFFPGLNSRLASLQSLRRIVETQLESGRATEIARLRKEHKKMGKRLHPDDKEFDLSELEEQITHLLPKLFRGGYVLTLWAVFERSLMDIAQKASHHVGLPISEDYFRRGSFFPSIRDAISCCSSVSAFPDRNELKKLKILQAVRQTLMHHDGRFAEAPRDLKALSSLELEAIGLMIQKDYNHDYLVPTEQFLIVYTELVRKCVQRIAKQVYDKVSLRSDA